MIPSTIRLSAVSPLFSPSPSLPDPLPPPPPPRLYSTESALTPPPAVHIHSAYISWFERPFTSRSYSCTSVCTCVYKRGQKTQRSTKFTDNNGPELQLRMQQT